MPSSHRLSTHLAAAMGITLAASAVAQQGQPPARQAPPTAREQPGKVRTDPTVRENARIGRALVKADGKWTIKANEPPTEADQRVALVTTPDAASVPLYAMYSCDSGQCGGEMQPEAVGARARVGFRWWRYLIGQWPMQTTPESSGGAQYGIVTLPGGSLLRPTGATPALFGSVLWTDGSTREGTFLFAPPPLSPGDDPDSGSAVRVWERGSAAEQGKLLSIFCRDVPQDAAKAERMIAAVFVMSDGRGAPQMTEPRLLDDSKPEEAALITLLIKARQKANTEGNLAEAFGKAAP